jgi:hypothetical protein
MTDLTSSGLGSTTDADRTVTAFFDTQDAADKARSDLVAAGITPDSITVAGGMGGDRVSDAEEGGFWHALKEFFIPDEDRYTYAEGLRRGGFALSVRTSETNYDRALDILDADGAVDIDEREKGWRDEGWTGYAGRPDPIQDTIVRARADAGTAGFGASLAGEDGYAPNANLTLTGTTEAETRADPSRVGTGAGSPGELNPDFRERIGSGTASMTPRTPTGAQDATMNDNAATNAPSYTTAAAAEDAALGSPTRSGTELPSARSTVGSMTSAETDRAFSSDETAGAYRRDQGLQRARVRGYIRDLRTDEDRTGTL